MGGKSSIERLPENVKKRIQQLLREGRLTFNGLVETIKSEFPEQSGLPSKSSVQRYNDTIQSIIKREKELAVISNAVIGEIGIDEEGKAGLMLSQLMTTVANRHVLAVLDKSDGGEMLDTSDLLSLARATKAALDSRSLSLKERKAVEEEARRKLLQEQDEKLKAMGNKGGVTDEAKRAIREALGIA